MIFSVKLADKTIQIESQYPELKSFFKDYIIEDTTTDLSVSWTRDEILFEQARSEEKEFSFAYLETLAALRKIAEILPQYQRFLIHGASITFDDSAYLFTAPSGTGKSTHIRLWRKHLGERVNIVNGDKPFVSMQHSHPRIYGTPWAGKENWQRNCCAPLKGICFLQRATCNSIRRLEPSECLPMLFKQVHLPANPVAAGLTLELIDQLINTVPLYLLECDISEEAVRCSFEAMTGLSYSITQKTLP